MFNSVFERITYLEYQLKAKNAIIAAFESEERYVKMQDEYFHNLRHLEIRVKSLETELEQAYRFQTKMRKNWMDVYEDLEREMKRKEKAYQNRIKNLEKKLLNALRELDTAKDKIKEQRGELYDVKTQLEEEKGKNQQLHAQINRDYENSSIPSSKTIRHKTEDTAAVVGFRHHLTVFHAEGVIVLAAAKSRRAKTCAKFDPLHRRNTKYNGGDTVFHAAEHRITQSCRKPRHDTFDDSAEGISLCLCRSDGFTHPNACNAADCGKVLSRSGADQFALVGNAADLRCAGEDLNSLPRKQLLAELLGLAMARISSVYYYVHCNTSYLS